MFCKKKFGVSAEITLKYGFGLVSVTAENNGRITVLAEIRACGNRNQFPLLEVAAKKYLCAPPSSVASERLICLVGQIYTDR